jgi:hypothetical protein
MVAVHSVSTVRIQLLKKQPFHSAVVFLLLLLHIIISIVLGHYFHTISTEYHRKCSHKFPCFLNFFRKHKEIYVKCSVFDFF